MHTLSSCTTPHLTSPTNSMIMMKLGGYSALDLCWYRQQGTNIFKQPMTVVDNICTAPEEQEGDQSESRPQTSPRARGGGGLVMSATWVC